MTTSHPGMVPKSEKHLILAQFSNSPWTGIEGTRPRYRREHASVCPGQQSCETVPHALMEDVRENACHNADCANREDVISGWDGLRKPRSGSRSRSLGHQFSMERV